MDILDFFGLDTNVQLSQSQKKHRANERSNLLVISRIVLKGFLKASLKLRHRILEGDIQQLCDLLMMVEKVLWHGFKSQHNVLAIRTVDAELWRCLTRISVTNAEMNECVHCIINLENLITPIARIRAFLRLAVMQKRLADYFQHISSSQVLREYYESWAFIRNEEVAVLTGSLVGLSVIDCNLLLDQDYLQQQPSSVDLSSYIIFPALQFEEDHGLNDNNAETSLNELNIVLDQKSYLEERNRYLEGNAASLKSKVMELEDALLKTALQDGGNIQEVQPKNQEAIEDLKKAKDCCVRLIEESNDTINALRQQLIDTKKVNEDLYIKIRMTEEKCKLFENDLIHTKERHVQEREQWLKVSEALKTKNLEKDAEIERNSSTMDVLKSEFINKTEEYMQTLAVLSKKQEELNNANIDLEKMRKQNMQLTEKLKEIPILKQELADLSANCEQQSKKIADYENALEELGVHLSESGLRILELKEGFLPFFEAQWQDDSSVTDCKACGATFSVSRRKHHCRSCGMIFCNACSDARIKLPSNPKPVRVCVSCYDLLRSKLV